jgi:hypothetical protein
MSNITASARMGFFTLAAAIILAAGLVSEARASHKVHTAHFHGLNARAHHIQSALVQENAGLGAMRYYGGPKSPTWREVR